MSAARKKRACDSGWYPPWCDLRSKASAFQFHEACLEADCIKAKNSFRKIVIGPLFTPFEPKAYKEERIPEVKMVEFVLKTETERRLYIDALLHCIDHGTLAEKDVLHDLEALLNQGIEAEDESASRSVLERLSGILASYRNGNRDRENAGAVLLQEINDFARTFDTL